MKLAARVVPIEAAYSPDPTKPDNLIVAIPDYKRRAMVYLYADDGQGAEIPVTYAPDYAGEQDI